MKGPEQESPLRRIRRLLGEMGEAELSVLSIMSGLDRTMTQACLEQLERSGRARQVRRFSLMGLKKGSGSCAASCCSAGSPGPAKPRKSSPEAFGAPFPALGQDSKPGKTFWTLVSQ